MNTESVYKKVHKIFDENQNDPQIEVEMRLGKFNGKMFDTNVGKDTFDRVYRALTKYQGWEKVFTTQEEVFYRDRDKIQVTKRLSKSIRPIKKISNASRVYLTTFAFHLVKRLQLRSMISVTWIVSEPSIVSHLFVKIFP
jgi:hypothetical protein